MKSEFIRKSPKYAGLLLLIFSLSSCSTHYSVKTYPAGAQVYTRDLQTNEKKLIGVSPADISGDAKLGDVFFVVVEKQNYKSKEILVHASEGETLTINARLDPMSGEELAANEVKKKEDDKKPEQPPQDPKKKKDKDLEAMMEELKLRVALLENTTSFYKDAMFSSRFNGNGQAKFDRDRGDGIVQNMFDAQQAIAAKDFVKANKLIDDAIEKDEYLSQAWLLKGSLRYLQNDMKGAKLAWERCLKIDPYDKVAYSYLAKVYEKLGIARLDKPAAAFRYPASTLEIESKKDQTARGQKKP
jgi:tetratricopeptide (TPR) repeat protein